MNGRYLACWSTIGAVLVTGCSDRKLDMDDEILVPEDTGVLEQPSRWDCPLQSIPEDEAVPDQVHYVVPIVDALRPDSTPPELEIQACLVLDGFCDEPVPSEVTKTDLTRPDLVRITLPYGFDGYLRLTAPGYATTMYYLGLPLIGNGLEQPPLPEFIDTLTEGMRSVPGRPIEMLRSNTLAQIHSDLGVPPDPSVGTLMVRAVDCYGVLGDGVRFALDGTVIPWVMRNGLITRSDGVLATDSSGMGGFLRVTPGVVRIDGSVLDSCFGDDCESTDPVWRVVTSVVTRVAPDAVTLVELRGNDAYYR
jgi:hypothetical protein